MSTGTNETNQGRGSLLLPLEKDREIQLLQISEYCQAQVKVLFLDLSATLVVNTLKEK
jgi:hypothetical protein